MFGKRQAILDMAARGIGFAFHRVVVQSTGPEGRVNKHQVTGRGAEVPLPERIATPNGGGE